MADKISKQDVIELVRTIPVHDLYGGKGLRRVILVKDFLKAIKCLLSQERTFENLDGVIARHEEIGYEQGWKDGYAQAVTENEPERRHKYD